MASAVAMISVSPTLTCGARRGVLMTARWTDERVLPSAYNLRPQLLLLLLLSPRACNLSPKTAFFAWIRSLYISCRCKSYSRNGSAWETAVACDSPFVLFLVRQTRAWITGCNGTGCNGTGCNGTGCNGTQTRAWINKVR